MVSKFVRLTPVAKIMREKVNVLKDLVTRSSTATFQFPFPSRSISRTSVSKWNFALPIRNFSVNFST